MKYIFYILYRLIIPIILIPIGSLIILLSYIIHFLWECKFPRYCDIMNNGTSITKATQHDKEYTDTLKRWIKCKWFDTSYILSD
jgi:hypothetical protein